MKIIREENGQTKIDLRNVAVEKARALYHS